MKIIFIALVLIALAKCSEHNPSSCVDALKNPRLDYITDTIADIKAKPDLTEGDYKYIKQLQDEEDAIWRSTQHGC